MSWLRHSSRIPQLMALNNISNSLDLRVKAMVRIIQDWCQCCWYPRYIHNIGQPFFYWYFYWYTIMMRRRPYWETRDIFGQVAGTQNVVIGLLVSQIYPDKKIGNLFNRGAEKGNLCRKVYSSQNIGWWGSDGVIQPNSCFGIFHPPGAGFLVFFTPWGPISLYQNCISMLRAVSSAATSMIFIG